MLIAVCPKCGSYCEERFDARLPYCPTCDDFVQRPEWETHMPVLSANAAAGAPALPNEAN